MDIGERIKALRKGKNFSQAQFADLIGVKNYVVANWEQGRSEPDILTINKIAAVLGVPAATLIDTSATIEKAMAAYLKTGKYSHLGPVVPVYKSIRCGTDKDGPGIDGEVIDRIPFDQATVDLGVFGIIAQGESMWGPPAWIREGFLVLFTPWHPGDFPNDRIVCATLEGHGDPVCKQLRKETGGQIVLISDNPDYKPLFLQEDQALVIHGLWLATHIKNPDAEKVGEDPAPYRAKKK